MPREGRLHQGRPKDMGEGRILQDWLQGVRSHLNSLKFTMDKQGCWVWNGSRESSGYGVISVEGRQRPAHRVSYELIIGPIPDGLQLDHLCRNRACINPLHLEPVTLKENVLRGNGAPAQNGRKEECKRGHPLEGSNVRWQNGARICRTCVREKTRRWKAAHKFRKQDP